MKKLISLFAKVLPVLYVFTSMFYASLLLLELAGKFDFRNHLVLHLFFGALFLFQGMAYAIHLLKHRGLQKSYWPGLPTLQRWAA